MTLSVHCVTHHYGTTRVLEDVSLDVQPGEILALLGPSGSGKSTLLRIAAGLEALQHGEIRFGAGRVARPGSEPPPESRSVGLVFQDYALFPHMTVRDNVAFGLRHHPADERDARAAERLAGVGLAGFGSRYPHTLSGGQQQRVALARALAPEPEVMLLDEPFASVDATLRRSLREAARRALKAARCPTIIVTHDPEEALDVADRIAVMVGGRIVQCDTGETIWRAPASRYVAELFGDAQTLAGTVRDGQVVTAFAAFPAPAGVTEAGNVDVVLRPASLEIRAGPGTARIVDVRFQGPGHRVELEAGGERLRALWQSGDPPTLGASVSVRFVPEEVFVYHHP